MDELWGVKAGNFLALKLLGLIYRISLHTTAIEEGFHYLRSYLNATLDAKAKNSSGGLGL